MSPAKNALTPARAEDAVGEQEISVRGGQRQTGLDDNNLNDEMPHVMSEDSASTPKVASLPPNKQIAICTRYYYGGFFFLPFLWLVNYAYFRPILGKDDTPAIVKKYVRNSLISFCIVVPIIIAWILVYQLQWENWGRAGELISVVVRKG